MILWHDLSYRLVPKPKAKNLTIEVKTSIVRHRSNHPNDRFERSIRFSSHEFMEEDESPGKEELFDFWADSGIDEDGARSLLFNMALLAFNASNTISKDFRGVLTLFVDCMVHIELDEDNRQIERAAEESFSEAKVKFRPASTSAIKSLNRRRFKKQGIKEQKCTICLESFVAGVRVANLPCGHEFHDRCAVEWLETSHVCPSCRFELDCEPESEQPNEADQEQDQS